MNYILEANKLCKKYGRNTVLNELDLHVPKGAIYGLIGRNGAGKTTFMRLVAGLIKSNGGDCKLMEVSINSKQINDIRRKMSTIIEVPAFYPDITVRENVIEMCRLREVEDYSIADEYLKLVSLDKDAGKRASKLSLGMKQRLGIAMAMVGNPEIILLDEPMNGLDPQGIIDIRNIILDLNKNRNITFVISSHLLDELSKVATHYGFISDGRLIREISAEEIKKDGNTTTTVVTPDTVKLAVLLDSMKLQYEIKSSSEAVVFAQLDLEEFMPQAKEAGIEINSLTVNSESLENVYLNTMGNKENC